MDLPQQVIELDGLTLRRFNGEADLPEFFRVIEESLEQLRPWMPWVAEHSLVEVVHDPANRASGAVPARLGFTEHLRRPAERLAPAETGEDQIWRLTRRQLESSSS